MSHPVVSVTVPVYNTSKYLRTCLDSLRMQTLKDIEYILVDDGSTDDSGLICDEYARKDSRFRVIHQKNGGLASARQTGLQQALGEYIIVCDSDDWAEPHMYENLYLTARNHDADIVTCGYYSEYSDGRSLKKQVFFKEKDGVVDFFDFLHRGAGSSWVKLIRKSLYERTNSTYEIGINFSEDALIIYKLLKGRPKIVQIPAYLYHYRRLYGGASYTNSIRMSYVFQLQFTYNWLKKNYTAAEYRPVIRQKAIEIAVVCLHVIDLDELYLRKFMSSELKWTTIVRGRLSLKSIMVCFEKIFPLCVARTILKTVYPFVYRYR
ncbi:glycosyltransferase [uncultured Alistipes sp.]|uniref:glycosyltransferase family 2 protein n=1 Tax=uncultured Alistipes sp. TaxID=538949 RepID=UPI0026382EFF|nr:glycosyltransferase [uncultured Alistipes sp.]